MEEWGERRLPPRKDKRVTLSDADLAFVEELVGRGLYTNKAEVVKEALMLLRHELKGEKPESGVGAAAWDWKVKQRLGGGEPGPRQRT